MADPIALLDDYENYLGEIGKAKTTEDAYRWSFAQLVPWMAGNSLQLSSLSIRDIRLFLRERNWGNSTTRQFRSALIGYVRKRYGNSHPLAEWKVRRDKTPPQRTLSHSEIERVLASFQPGISRGNRSEDRRFWICDTKHPLGIRNRAILWLLCDTGYRSRETCRLSLANTDTGLRSSTVLAKGGDYHTRSYTEQAEGHLFAWLAIRSKFVTPSSGNALFIGTLPQTKGAPLTHNGLRVMLRKLGHVTGVPALSPHVFRRTKATLMQSVAGAPSRLVQLDMDWADIKEVERYSQAIQKEAARKYLPGNFLLKGADVSA